MENGGWTFTGESHRLSIFYPPFSILVFSPLCSPCLRVSVFRKTSEERRGVGEFVEAAVFGGDLLHEFGEVLVFLGFGFGTDKKDGVDSDLALGVEAGDQIEHGFVAWELALGEEGDELPLLGEGG